MWPFPWFTLGGTFQPSCDLASLPQLASQPMISGHHILCDDPLMRFLPWPRFSPAPGISWSWFCSFGSLSVCPHLSLHTLPRELSQALRLITAVRLMSLNLYPSTLVRIPSAPHTLLNILQAHQTWRVQKEALSLSLLSTPTPVPAQRCPPSTPEENI